MFNQLPARAETAVMWEWSQFQPYFDDLLAREITDDSIHQWLLDFTSIANLISEISTLANIGVSVDTTDTEAEARFDHYYENISPPYQEVTNALNKKFLASGIEPEAIKVPLRNIRADVELFREANVPIFTQIRKLGTEYDKTIAAQTVMWQGEELTLSALQPFYLQSDRSIREQVFRLEIERSLKDRQTLNELWVKLYDLRSQVAKNAGFDNFMDYQWQALGRFDYTPEDTRHFHQAIEETVVPVARRLYEKRRQRLGVDSLRPWDLYADTSGHPPLNPFQHKDELIAGSIRMFEQLDPQLGHYVATMADDGLLDLDNRKGKAPGGYCTYLSVKKRPYIFMNAVGIHEDVQTMLHEAGHSFHDFDAGKLPYYYQHAFLPMEFCEVASMAMELLSAPYLTKDRGGFYTNAEAARARIEHLEECIKFWPYMAVVDSFQHWAYNHPEGRDPQACDAKWIELYNRFMQGIDYSGLENWQQAGWQRKLHIFLDPFYYVEYGLAQLGAVQVWRNSLSDQAGALASYRKALQLGATVTLPELFQTAGAKLAFDSETLGGAVSLMERTIDELESQAEAN